jgi:hypothetical protein
MYKYVAQVIEGNHKQDNQLLERESKLGSSECESELLTTTPRRSVK